VLLAHTLRAIAIDGPPPAVAGFRMSPPCDGMRAGRPCGDVPDATATCATAPARRWPRSPPSLRADPLDRQ